MFLQPRKNRCKWSVAGCFSEHPYIQKKKVGQDFFSEHDRDVDLLYFGLCLWSSKMLVINTLLVFSSDA